ncbi:MAG: NTP transferase domain-containing protein [Candidatus Kapabacteria bacterium]|nr:NTP transferase domain-containing protein [Candidatus Kapabacteria bacterium]MDW8224996.1 NTP transferase domain-containing protein [Bacteroidota bacterium]
MKPTAVVVLAAGKGKRIGHPELPKVLLPVWGRPLLAYVLDAVCVLQPRRLLVVVGFRGETVEAFVREWYPQAEIVWQPEQLGTGHAVLQTQPHVGGFHGDVLIVTGDTPLIQGETIAAFLAYHRHSGNVVSVLTTYVPEPTGYGRILRNGQGELIRIVEEHDAMVEERSIREVNTGIIAAQATILYELLPQLGRYNAQREYYLTDLVALCRQQGYPVGAYCAPQWEQFQGVNTLEELRRVEIFMAQFHAREVGVKG